MNAAPPLADTALAVTHLGSITVAVEAARVAAFHSAGERDADVDLADLIGLALPADSAPEHAARLVELSHPGGLVLLGVHGQLHLVTAGGGTVCHCPALIAGVLRRSCLRAVVHHDDGLMYLLDVDQIAARVRQAKEGQAPCASD